MSDRCTYCDRPLAQPEDWDRYEGGEGAHLCWSNGECERPELFVDWRTRALRAEALLGCAAEVALAIEWEGERYSASLSDSSWTGPTPPDLDDGLRLLATDPAELMRLVPETKVLIERALAKAGVGLEEQC